MPTYVLSNISYWELGPKLFFEVNFAFFWKLAFSHCNCTIQYTVNYNGKTPTLRNMQNSSQKKFLHPFINSMCLKWHMWATFTRKKFYHPPCGGLGPLKIPEIFFKKKLSDPFFLLRIRILHIKIREEKLVSTPALNVAWIC